MRLPSRTRRLAMRRGFVVAPDRKAGCWALTPLADFPTDPVQFLASQLAGTEWQEVPLAGLTMSQLIRIMDAPTTVVDGVKTENVPFAAKIGRPSVPIADRLWSRLDFRGDSDECWQWPGSLNFYGYGILHERVGGVSKTRQAHIVAYESTIGPVPAGLHIDHTCHGADLDCPGGGPECLHRRCVNPAHLEPVTQAENNRRMQARKLSCVNDHALAGGNLYINPTSGHRACRTCKEAARRRFYEINGPEYFRRWRESRNAA